MGRAEQVTPPRVANNTDSEINKALIDFGKLVDSETELIRSEFTAADGLIESRVVALESNLDILARSYKAGGVVSYSGVADTHTVQTLVAGIWYQGTAPGAVMRRYLVAVPQTTITNAMAGYPAAGAWVYVTVDYLGVLRLRAATGAGTVRPTDNYFQYSGGGVGYYDIDRNGYYYADGERIIGAFHKVSNTEFRYITNHAETHEEGEFTATMGGTVTFGAQTYARQGGYYERHGFRAKVWAYIEITAKGAGIAGSLCVALPFSSVPRGGAPAAAFPGFIPFHAVITYSAGYSYLGITANGTGGSIAQVLQNGSGVGGGSIPIAQVGATAQLVYCTEMSI